MGCGFRLWPRWEATSRFDHKSRVALSAKTLNRKLHPISRPNAGIHFPLSPSTGKCIPFHSQIPGHSFRNPAHPESPSHSTHIGAWNNQLIRPSINKGAPSCHEKSPENFEAFTFVLFCTKDHERRSYSPSTAFLAAAAMLSRSSLVGWSFAATQLSSSILNRAFSGSCSSMAS